MASPAILPPEDESVPKLRLIATYERVSTEQQQQRASILLQYEEMSRRLTSEPDAAVVERYIDDGVSGMIELRARPAGARLMRDAALGKFHELWVYKLDRLGREVIDPFVVRRDLLALGVKVVSVTENIESMLTYGLQVLLSSEERTKLLDRSKLGTERIVKSGNGGIIPYGYRREGRKTQEPLIIDESPVTDDKTAADIIRWLYDLVGRQGLNCYQVAQFWNSLQVPTHYAKDARLVGNEEKGKRKEHTSGTWRPSRIRALVRSTTYRGEFRYGKNPKATGPDGKRIAREIISVECPAIVSPELWQAAQDTIANARLGDFQSTHRRCLLRKKVTCGCCGLQYSGSWHTQNGNVWYRCGGKTKYRGPLGGRCPSPSLNGDVIEPVILDDITRFLRNPGTLLDELAAECQAGAAQAVAESEWALLCSRLTDIERRRARLVQHLRDELITVDEFRENTSTLAADKTFVEARLARLTPEPAPVPVERLPHDLLADLRRRLDAGLSEDELFDIVGLLVEGVTVHMLPADGKRVPVRLEVRYRFAEEPTECSVVPIDTGTRAGQNYTSPQRLFTRTVVL